MMTEIIEGVKACGTITSLDLSGNSLVSQAPVEAISTWLMTDTVCLTLKLVSCGLNKRTLEFLRPGLTLNKTLKELRLLDTQEYYSDVRFLSNTGLKDFADDLLAAVNPDLRVNFEAGEEDSSYNVRDLEDELNFELATKAKLPEWKLQGKDVGEVGALQIARRFHEIEATTFSFESQTLGNQGFKELCEKFATSTRVHTVKFSATGAEDADGICIADLLKRNHSITEIDVSKNPQLRADGIAAIAEALKINTSVKTIDLTEVGLNSTQAVSSLCEIIENSKSITKLGLDCRIIPLEEKLKIYEALQNSDILESLSFSSHFLKKNELELFSSYIQTNTHLKHLNLDQCSFGEPEFSEFLTALHLNKSIETLQFPGLDVKLVLKILKFLETNATLKAVFLNAFYCKINDDIIPHVSEVIRSNQVLKMLSIPSATFTEEAVQHLKQDLKHNTSLRLHIGDQTLSAANVKNFDLWVKCDEPWRKEFDSCARPLSNSWNFLYGAESFPEEAGLELADRLADEFSLKQLTINTNNSQLTFDHKGWTAIFNSIVNHPNLQELYLNHKFEDEDAVPLAHMIKTSKTVQKLSIFWINIGEAGLKEIISALGESQSITDMELSGPVFPLLKNPESCALELIASLKKCKSLKRLEILDIFYECGEDVWNQTFEAINQSNLTSICMSGEIPSNSMQAFANALSKNNKLTELRMPAKRLGESALLIVNALKNNKIITKLDFSSNHLGNNGVTQILSWLETNNTIEKVDLSGNEFGDDIIPAVDSFIKKNKKVVRLLLGNSSLTTKAIDVWSASLKFNHSLRQIDLKGLDSEITRRWNQLVCKREELSSSGT